MKKFGLILIVAAMALAMSARTSAQQAHPRKARNRRGPAQDPPRFAPPRPPALDQDFDDPGEDELDSGDAPNRAQVPPPSSVPPPVAPGNDFRPPPTSGAGAAPPSKLRFELADGEYYEKGKKRGRSPMAKRTTQSVPSH